MNNAWEVQITPNKNGTLQKTTVTVVLLILNSERGKILGRWIYCIRSNCEHSREVRLAVVWPGSITKTEDRSLPVVCDKHHE